MRNIKNIGMSGRSILCTIHQPSREIFSCFDALLLLKRGGSTLFFGELGENARNLTTYLARASGIPFSKAENPANFMLDATKEDAAGSVDFAAVWAESDLAKQCDAMIESMLGAGEPDKGRELTVEHAFAASELQQITTLSWKYTVSYWRKVRCRLRFRFGGRRFGGGPTNGSPFCACLPFSLCGLLPPARMCGPHSRASDRSLGGRSHAD